MKCKACGAEIEFNPELQKLKCSYCDSEFEVSEYAEQIKSAKELPKNREEAAGPQIESKSYTCTQCGAKLLTFDDTAITFCSYCDSSNIIETELYKGEAPEYVIPFKITKEECEKIYKQEIKKHFLAPKEMMDEVVIKKFRGIYMPYVVYKATHKGVQVNRGEKYSHHSGNYDYYNLYDIHATIDAEYEGMAYDLSSSFYDKFSQAIAPFDFTQVKEFNINYLSGYYADSRDVKKHIYSDEAKKIIEPDTERELLKYKEFRKYGCAHPQLTYTIEDQKIAYYPVYFLAVRNKKNNTINYAVVNGQTGKIAVELPIDFKKYLIFILVIAVPVFIFLNLLFTITPRILLIISIILAIINLIFIKSQNTKIKKQEEHEDDKGFLDVQNSQEDPKNKIIKSKEIDKNIKTSITEIIISLILCIAIFYINPANDMYYYIVIIISLVIVLSTFKKIIEQYNQLTSRKLSQIGIRGGDENEN